MNFNKILDERRALIESYIESKLVELEDPPVAKLVDAMRYSLDGGKRVRAILVMLAAELAGSDAQKVLPVAGAVECFHAYSLIHDDLPEMDDALERRGLPSVHVSYGEAVAILAGDSLLPLGFEWISEDQRDLSSGDQVLKVLALFAKTLGTTALTGGQYLDLYSPPALRQDDEILKRKTAALIETALLAGAILGGMAEPQLSSLKTFGFNLGMAYQWADDLLDKEEDAKPSTIDAMELQRRIDEATGQALDALAPFGDRAINLRELTQHLAQRSQ